MGKTGLTFQTSGVTNIETGIKANKAHMYQHALAAQSDIGPAIAYPNKNLFVPGQESCKKGIIIKG